MILHDFDQVYSRPREGDCKKWSTVHCPADAIPMWLADTDFRAPQPVIDALHQRVEEGLFGYTTVSPRLRTAVQGWVGRRFGFPVKAEEVEYVPGVVGGLICALRALTRAGDRVVLQTPSYPPFRAALEQNGLHLAANPMILENGRYVLDFAGFEEQCRHPRTKVLILCNPHNPTGRVFTREELERLGEICLRHGIYVLCDEIHCDLVYDGFRHLPFASLSPEFSQITATFINPSKTFNVPGLRTAAMICKNPRMKEDIHQVVLSNKAIGENIFGTLALCVAYESCDDYADQLMQYIQKNRAVLMEALKTIPGIRLVAGEGTYLMWLDCRHLGLTQAELMDRFVSKAKVGVQSGTDFGSGGTGFVRMNIACPRATLDQAIAQLRPVFSL